MGVVEKSGSPEVGKSESREVGKMSRVVERFCCSTVVEVVESR
jgi:hypothetical protein